MASFYQWLKDGKFMSDDKLKAALAEQQNPKYKNGTFFAALKRAEVLEEEQLLQFAREFFNMGNVTNPYHTDVDFTLTEKVEQSVQKAIDNRRFAIHLEGRLAYVLNDPENDTLRSKVTSALGDEPYFVLVSEMDFEIFKQYQLIPRAIAEQAKQIKVSAGGGSFGGGEDAGQSASYTQKLLDMMIGAALERRASDLHLQKLDDRRAQILLRVDGEIYPFTDINPDVLVNLRNKLKTMSGVGGETPNAPVEGQIRVKHRGKDVDIRVNIISTANGYDFCLRFIDTSLKSLEELGLSKANYNTYMKLLHMTKGMVIVSGPTGSGKTSLLYAGFKKLLAERKQIFTIEDPVEITLPGISQVEVKKEQHLTYEKQFPSALRHDPDVIGIGETRTKDVGLQAIQAANTGHLVFTTLHTNDSVGAISRLTNMGIEPYTLGDSLAAVVAQRLVRRICTHCIEEYELEADHPWRERYGLGDGIVKLKRGKGCSHCAGTGFLGRIAVNEILVTNAKLRDAIQKGATRTEIEEILDQNGFKTYVEDAADKARAGITSFTEVDHLYADIV